MAPKKPKPKPRKKMNKISLSGITALASFGALAIEGKGGNAVLGFQQGGIAQGINTLFANIAGDVVKTIGIPLTIGVVSSFLPSKTLLTFGKFRVTT